MMRITNENDCYVRMSHYGTCDRGTKGCSRRDHTPDAWRKRAEKAEARVAELEEEMAQKDCARTNTMQTEPLYTTLKQSIDQGPEVLRRVEAYPSLVYQVEALKAAIRARDVLLDHYRGKLRDAEERA